MADYTHPFLLSRGYASRCPIRLNLSQDERDMPIVIYSKMPNDPGVSVTHALEIIPAEIVARHSLLFP